MHVIQEKVACLEDNDARLALEPQNKYKIQVLMASCSVLQGNSMIVWLRSLFSKNQWMRCILLTSQLDFQTNCNLLTISLWVDKTSWTWWCACASLFKWHSESMVCLKQFTYLLGSVCVVHFIFLSCRHLINLFTTCFQVI